MTVLPVVTGAPGMVMLVQVASLKGAVGKNPYAGHEAADCDDVSRAEAGSENRGVGAVEGGTRDALAREDGDELVPDGARRGGAGEGTLVDGGDGITAPTIVTGRYDDGADALVKAVGPDASHDNVGIDDSGVVEPAQGNRAPGEETDSESERGFHPSKG